jgi:hypothetical protein
MRSRLYSVLAFLLLFAGIASARTGLKVEKKAISVTPSSSSGRVVVWGPPGSVRCTAPVNIKVYNKAKKIMKGGVAAEDGSFAITAIGHDGDRLKVRFVSWTGQCKSIRLKVPEKSSPPPVETLMVVEEKEVTGVSADEEEAESVEEVLASPPVVAVEPMIPAVEEGGGAAGTVPAIEGEPVVPETLPPSPVLEERLVETGELEYPDVAFDEGAAPDAALTDSPAAKAEEEVPAPVEAELVEEALALPPVVDVEPELPTEKEGPMPSAESEPIVPETIAPPPPIEESLVQPEELDSLPVEVDAVEVEVEMSDEPPAEPAGAVEAPLPDEAAATETTAPPPAGEEEPPAMMESGSTASPIEEKTPGAE